MEPAKVITAEEERIWREECAPEEGEVTYTYRDLRRIFATLDEARRLDVKMMFPVMPDKHAVGPLRIPWSIAEIAYGGYVRRYGNQQSLERIAERGGFYWGELDEYFPKWREESSEIFDLRRQVECIDLFESGSLENSKVFEVLLAAGRIPMVKPGPGLDEIVSKLLIELEELKRGK